MSLHKVAAALGVTKMALYRYVGSWDELIELMADAATGPAPALAERDLRDWRAGVTTWALALREVLVEHPWLAPSPIVGPPRGPHSIAWMDAMFRVLRDTGLDWGAKVGVLIAAEYPCAPVVHGRAASHRRRDARRARADRPAAHVRRRPGRAGRSGRIPRGRPPVLGRPARSPHRRRVRRRRSGSVSS